MSERGLEKGIFLNFLYYRQIFANIHLFAPFFWGGGDTKQKYSLLNRDSWQVCHLVCNLAFFKHINLAITVGLVYIVTQATHMQTCVSEYARHKALWPHQAQNKKIVMLPITRPKSENWVGRSIFFFLFFFFNGTVRELSFSIFLKKFLNGENSGGMQSKRIYKCFFKPLNTDLANSSPKSDIKKKKKNDPVFFAFYGRSGEGNIKKKKIGLIIHTE